MTANHAARDRETHSRWGLLFARRHSFDNLRENTSATVEASMMKRLKIGIGRPVIIKVTVMENMHMTPEEITLAQWLCSTLSSSRRHDMLPRTRTNVVTKPDGETQYCICTVAIRLVINSTVAKGRSATKDQLSVFAMASRLRKITARITTRKMARTPSSRPCRT